MQLWEIDARNLWIDAARARDWDTVGLCECALHGIVAYATWAAMTCAGREAIGSVTMETAQTAIQERIMVRAVAVARTSTPKLESARLDDLVRRTK